MTFGWCLNLSWVRCRQLISVLQKGRRGNDYRTRFTALKNLNDRVRGTWPINFSAFCRQRINLSGEGARWVRDGPPDVFYWFHFRRGKSEQDFYVPYDGFTGAPARAFSSHINVARKMKSVVFISSTMMKNIFILYDGRSRYLALYKENWFSAFVGWDGLIGQFIAWLYRVPRAPHKSHPKTTTTTWKCFRYYFYIIKCCDHKSSAGPCGEGYPRDSKS